MREDSKEFFNYHKMLANNLKRKDLEQMIWKCQYSTIFYDA